MEGFLKYTVWTTQKQRNSDAYTNSLQCSAGPINVLWQAAFPWSLPPTTVLPVIYPTSSF